MAAVNTVNPGDGHRGRDEFPRESDEYRGAHRRADEPDEAYEDYEGYEDYADEPEYVEAEPVEEAGAGYVSADEARAGSTAVAAGAGAAAAAPAAARLPKRGLAMILLAVGLLLLLWGIFALGQGKDSSENAAQETQASQSADKGAADSTAPGANNDANANGADNNAADKPAANNDTADSENNGDAANPDADRENKSDEPDANNPGNAAQPNPAAPDLTAQNAQVYVFNNSGVPDLANQTAGKLEGQYSVANKSQDAAAMNMPEQTFGVFPETFVFYNPQVAGAEQVAADIAQRVGGTPHATNDLPGNDTQLPSEALQNRHAITVVLAG